MSAFLAAVVEELWIRGTLVERRLTCGEAVERDGFIVAYDRLDPLLISRCEDELAAMRPLVDSRFRVRLIAEASLEAVRARMLLGDGTSALVSDPEHLAGDLTLLSAAAATRRRPGEASGLPFLWRHGSAAVLLHEAVGHPFEHGRETTLPSWLHVDIPLENRRASFRDVPLRRMTAVNASQLCAPFALPAERVEVSLVDGGSWDPLTDLVSIHISFAEVVEGSERMALEPFTVCAPRTDVIASLRGAEGEPERYPGVICSREGQELFVASSAPRVLTELA